MSHAQNMYRVGDFVYFEVSANAPYQVRKIEDLNKTASGQVEARVTLYYRRRDVSSALLKIADQAERRFDEYYEVDKLKPDNYGSSGHTIVNGSDLKEEDKEDREIIMTSDNAHVRKDEEEDKSEWGSAGLPLGADALDTRARHRLRQRELFLSRQVETLPATQIRGKCHVTLLSEIETPDSYDQEDSFFYSLVYDPTQMTLLADKGAIRVGEKYQADVPETMENNVMGESDENKENGNGALMIDESVEDETSSESRMLKETEREVVVYHPHHSLTDRDMDQFLIIARAVGTFSRALDTSSSTKLPSLHMTAAAASRDVTLFHAMALLHQAGYDIGQATKFLVPPPNKSFYPLEADKATGHNTVSLGGPILCRDQMEEWSAAEANLFEEAMEKYGKDFSDVRSDFLPWKSIRDIVEYYYMWKTTNRYVEQKKKKHAEQESKLKQVYIPNFNRVNPTAVVKGADPCEGCKCTDASGWFAWGPAHLNLRLCQDCWTMWKKNGGLRDKHEYETYDLDGAANEAVNDVRPVTSTVNPMSINKNSAAAQNRPVVSGQVVARLPPNHPHAHAISGSISGTMGKQQLKGPFTMVPSLMYRIARRVCPRSLLNLRMAARRPSLDINATAIKNFCYSPDAVSVVLAAARHIKQLRHHTLSPNFAQNYTIQQAHHIQQQATTKRPASSAGNEPPLKKEKLLRAADGIVPLPIVLPTPTLPSLRTHPVAHKSDSRWRCSSGQLVFVAGPKFRRRRLEIIPRGQLARRLARRPFVSEHQTTLSNSMSALASYLPSDTFNSSTPSIEYNSNAMIFGPLP